MNDEDWAWQACILTGPLLLTMTETTEATVLENIGIGTDKDSGSSNEENSPNSDNPSTPESLEEKEEKVAVADMDEKPIKMSKKRSFLERPISVQVPNQLNLSMSDEKIYKDANFSSFVDFQQAFEEWKQLYHHPFRVASSEKHDDPELEARFKYRYVVYHCSRYGEPRKRGAGRRPHQNYLPCGCNAKLRVNFHPHTDGGALCVTTLITDHNHAPIDESNAGNGGVDRPIKKWKFEMSDADEGEENKFNPGGENNPEFSPDSSIASFGALSAMAVADNSALTAAAFSPLSLQHALHHSPSSGGQSSSESVNELLGELGQGLATLMSNQNNKITSATMPMTESHGSTIQMPSFTGSGSQQQAILSQMDSNLGVSGTIGPLGAYLAKAASQRSLAAGVPLELATSNAQANNNALFQQQQNSLMIDLLNRTKREQPQQQQQQNLLPLLQEFFRSASGGGLPSSLYQGEHRQEQKAAPSQQSPLLLGLLLSPRQQQQQQRQHQQQQQSTNNANAIAHNSASALLSAMLEQSLLQQQNAQNINGTAAANASPAAPSLSQMLLSLNMLANNNNSSGSSGQRNAHLPSSSSAQSQQMPPPPTPASANYANSQQQQQLMQIFQWLAANGQSAQQGKTTANSNPGDRNQRPKSMAANAAANAKFRSAIVKAEPLTEPATSSTSSAHTRTNLLKEAESLLFALVVQMSRTRDLPAYLHRLRQFLADVEFCD